MDDTTLGPAEIVGIASVALFAVSLFLPWFTVSVDDPSGILTTASFPDHNGWDVHLMFSLLPLVLGATMLTVLLLGRLAPDLDLSALPPWLPLLLGGAAAALVLLQLLIGAEVEGAENAETFGASIEVSRGYGIFVALLATFGMIAAGLLRLQHTATAPTGGPTTSPPQPS